ncbi:MAG: cysteine synthase A [Alphaproteobacteria bacterium]|nr:cysteine synthase A [Alphaproteobacteria bacterium]
MQKIYNSVTEMVGRTPLVNLSRLAKKFKVKANILAKCEFYNPVFSVKDRVALKMIEKAEEAGLVREDTVFVEATSGNTGIGLAAVCAARGYKLVIIMPENMSQERIKLMRHFGAEVILTPAEDGMTGSINKAEILAEKNPAVLLLRQFENEANPDAHKFGTSIEILEDTGGDVDCLVSAVGTAGTVSGIASALRTYNPELYVAAVEPAASPVLNGGKAGPHKIPGIGAGFVPKFYDPKLIDEVIDVKDEEAADMAKATARCEGLAVGVSAGAALAAAVKIGQRQEMKGKNIVVILPDAAERYLSTGLLD